MIKESQTNDYRWNTRNFKNLQRTLLAGAAASLLMLSAGSIFAYDRYNDGCNECHGAFNDATSTKDSIFPPDNNNKHDMHRYTMNTDCALCHQSGDQKNPYIGSSTGTSNNQGLGCTGCHEVSGLRQHHMINGVVDAYGDDCSSCHAVGTPVAENIKPPYYGTADTLVENPCNDVLASNTNENWTVGDFLGTDNDGDNLYDLADYSCGPLRMVEVVPEGNNLLVRWETAGGRSNEWIQATAVLTNGFSDVVSSGAIPGVGIVTQEVELVNGATGSAGFYKVRSNP
jgi:hypothetical protein